MTGTPSAAAAQPGRALRADAVRNRARVLAAARVLFAERGLQVTLDEIARRAGLGTGTVYRRFADRDALVDALFEERLDEQVAVVEECLTDEDPWRGFARLVTDCCDRLALDRGLREVVLSSAHGRERVHCARLRLVPRLDVLVRRAQAAGVLRQDVGVADVPLVFLMIGTVADYTADVDRAVHRRFVALLLEGMRARPDQEPLPGAPLDDAALACAMRGRRS